MRGCSYRTVLSTLQRLTTVAENVEVCRKFKKRDNTEIWWWFRMRVEESVLQNLDQEWVNIKNSTSWKLECCYQPVSASATHDLVGEGHNVHTTMHQTTSEEDGGGVLMYAQHNLIVNVLPSQLQYNVPHNLEVLPISVRHNSFKVGITLFYKLSSASSLIFDTLFDILENMKVAQFYFSRRFYINFNDATHHLYSKLCNISQLFNLTQVVNGCTHVSPCGNPALIDLAFMSSPSQLLDCSVFPPIANSDHNGLKIKVNWKPSAPPLRTCHNTRAIWQYAHADFNKARELIHNTEWNTICSSNDIDSCWAKWQSTFLSIMEESIPKKALPPCCRNLPWLNKNLVKSMQ